MSESGMNPADVVMYWRPGCGFCGALARRLSETSLSVEKRNIWDDAEAAAFVRGVASGNETVPTVVVKGRALVNPSVEEILAALAE